jgi:hypothetical protein
MRYDPVKLRIRYGACIDIEAARPLTVSLDRAFDAKLSNNAKAHEADPARS